MGMGLSGGIAVGVIETSHFRAVFSPKGELLVIHSVDQVCVNTFRQG
jgi:hypothetical protein